ncbi:MAG: DUF302 domain-containing protein [Chloroflexi bacterium]|nr:DUF302 domain-containing protein [Chloroflexota bacterium]
MAVTATAYGLQTVVKLPFEEAVQRTKNALKGEGFGILTEIDVQKTLKDKLGVGFEPYIILGACNPPLAHRSLQAEHDLGLLLPCNVIVHQHGDEAVVAAADPRAMLGIVDNEAVQSIAEEARARLERALSSL